MSTNRLPRLFFRQQHFLLLAFIFIIGTMSACAEETPTPTTTTAVIATTEPTNTPEPTSTPEPTPTSTPIPASVTVSDQVLTENGSLIISAASIPQVGWLVIHAITDGQIGEVLGQAPLEIGGNVEVELTIEPNSATDMLAAMLHVDEGTSGTFEFPGPDEPLLVGETAVSQRFAVEVELPRPAIAVEAQTVAEDGFVRLSNVLALEPSWLVIHTLTAEGLGSDIGHVLLEEGRNENVVTQIRWREATPQLLASLYADSDENGRFDPTLDQPITVRGEPIATEFDVILPRDIAIVDQPVINGRLLVDRVISNGSSFLVVYSEGDIEGTTGFIIGSVRLEDGLNQDFMVEVQQSSVTDRLYFLLHEDTDDESNEFDFPRNDLPQLYNGRLPAPFSISTIPGPYLSTTDQPLVDESIIVPLVVSDINVWLVLYDEAGGEPDQILSQVWLPAGVNKMVLLPAAGAAGDLLHAALHVDEGEPQEFEFPDGVDVPLQRNRTILQAPFSLLNE